MLRHLLSVAVATALLAGCGSGGDEPETAVDGTEVTVPDTSASPDGSGADGSATTGATTATSGTTAAAQGSLDPETLALIEACGAEDRILTAADVPLDPAQAALVRDAEGNVLCLGPEGMAGDGVDSAEAVLDFTDEWTINLVLNDPGLERFNQMAELCFVDAPDPDQCPSARLALLVEAEVLSSPTMNARSFSNDDIVISGEFEKDEAQSLADQIESGQLSVRPVLADLGPI